MAEANDHGTVLKIAYGSESAVDRDVDLFEAFYAGCFKEEALTRLVARVRRRYRTLSAVLCVCGALLVLPMAINPSSIFAVILLAMGVLLLLVGVYFAYRTVTAQRFCEENFQRLLGDEFAATRSVTKRVFDMCFSEQDVVVEFGTRTAIRQTRRKRYEDIAGVYVTDELVFIKGLTWISRFQLDESELKALCALLEERCVGRYHDCVGRACR